MPRQVMADRSIRRQATTQLHQALAKTTQSIWSLGWGKQNASSAPLQKQTLVPEGSPRHIFLLCLSTLGNPNAAELPVVAPLRMDDDETV